MPSHVLRMNSRLLSFPIFCEATLAFDAESTIRFYRWTRCVNDAFTVKHTQNFCRPRTWRRALLHITDIVRSGAGPAEHAAGTNSDRRTEATDKRSSDCAERIADRPVSRRHGA